MQRLLAACVIVVLLGCSSDDEPEVAFDSATVDDRSSDREKTTTTEADRASTSRPRPRPTTTTVPRGPRIVIAEVGLTSGPGYQDRIMGTAGAVIQNQGDEQAAFFEVVFTFRDDAGPVGTETTYVYAVDPGGTAHASVEAIELQRQATSVEAVAIVEDDLGIFSGQVIPVTVNAVAPGRYGGTEVTGTASNPTQTVLERGGVACVLRRAGVIVGGIHGFLDTIAPGSEVAWEASSSSLHEVVGDSAECSASLYS